MKLKKQRERAGLTQEALANRAGVDPATVSRLERRRRGPKAYEAVIRIARTLNQEPEQLFPVPGFTPDAETPVAPVLETPQQGLGQ